MLVTLLRTLALLLIVSVSIHPPDCLCSLPGDYGFDPLGLGSDPEILKYFVQAELVHARFAMTAVAGILIPGVSFCHTPANPLN